MTHLVIASSVVAVLLAQNPPAKPDFSGTWHMDPSRSQSAVESEPIGPITVVITQTAAEFRIETTSRLGKANEVFRFTTGEAPPVPNVGSARWRGNTLTTDVVREVRGQSVTVQQSRSLSADQSEMVVETITNVQHGYSQTGTKVYGAGKDVFTRMRSQ
jgi:hypothetical protein